MQEKKEKTWKTFLLPPIPTFPQQVGFTLITPAEWPQHSTKIMCECVYEVDDLTTLNSSNLEFITEQEVTALHCLNAMKNHNLHSGEKLHS
ncbi:hypothetical protein RclHR1_00260015 [Rhizophagus clarus]|uniref:Uncharacterized protein n=1 Tax=Rhizophagus clarus TaxID=94130 RepID=A0A2Z6R0D7_9GLOM|nr:hypothetical protein RclHR1_00260015 [Rhizophagus clarus]